MISKRTILALCPYVFSSLLTFAQPAQFATSASFLCQLKESAGRHEPQSGDEAAVRDALAAFVAAFNSRDRARLNQLRTPDMDRRSNQNGEILLLGDQTRGTPVMNNPGDNQQWTRTVDKVRFVTPDAAIVDTHGDETRTDTKTGERAVRHVFNTYIMARGADGAWRVAASRY